MLFAEWRRLAAAWLYMCWDLCTAGTAPFHCCANSKYLPNGQLLRLAIRAASTRSCNLYVFVNAVGQFLRSDAGFHFYAYAPQFRAQLLRRLELNPGEPQPVRRFHIRRDVINVQR